MNKNKNISLAVASLILLALSFVCAVIFDIRIFSGQQQFGLIELLVSFFAIGFFFAGIICLTISVASLLGYGIEQE